MTKKGIHFLVVGISLLVMFLSACGESKTESKPYKIGVVIYVEFLTPCYEGFKAGMTESGYAEDEKVTYIYNGVVDPTPEAVDSELQNLMDQHVDMLLAVGNLASVRAKDAVADTDTPVVFCAVSNPIGEGLVESISHPGGNLTGVQAGLEIAKGLELLVTLTQAKKVYIPYNPDDEVSQVLRAMLDEPADLLGVELVDGEVYSGAEAATAIENLPADIGVIYRIPSPTLDPDTENSAVSQAAIQRRLPIGAGLHMDGMVLSVGVDMFQAGEETARQAAEIFDGTKPADLAVRSAEYQLIINLPVAEAIGLEIPDSLLSQANVVIREEE